MDSAKASLYRYLRQHSPNLSGFHPTLLGTSATAFWCMQAVYLAITLPMCFLGYGSDNDTFGVIGSGLSTWRDHIPKTSRHPGYWLYEALTYVLASSGGYLLSNLASCAIGAALLWRMFGIAVRAQVPNPALSLMTVVVTPVFLIACASSIDYIWAALCLVVAIELLWAGKCLLAGFVAALVIGFRGSDSVVLAGAFGALLVHAMWGKRSVRQSAGVLASALVAVVLGALFYIPSYLLANHSFDFLTPMIGGPEFWTLKMWVGRFLYKSLYLLGPASALLILAAIPQSRRQPSRQWPVPTQPLLLTSAGVVLGNVALFAKYPIEISYLIPMLPFLVILLDRMVFAGSLRWTLALVLTTFSLNLVVIDLAKPNEAGKATDAHFALSIRDGVLVGNVRARLALRDCADLDCWVSKQSLGLEFIPR